MKAQITILVACLVTCLSLTSAETTMLKVEMFAPVVVYDVSAPNFTWGSGSNPPQVVDAKRLQSINGAGPPDRLAEYLADGSQEEMALAKVVSGGKLKLSYAPGNADLTLLVTYEVSRKLTAKETEALREYTYGQLLDGVGESFQQTYARQRTRLWIAFEDIDREDLRVKESER